MDIEKLHEKFQDKDSPSIEGQVRWLQKQGFLQNHIDQAMIQVYGDIERGHAPWVFSKTIKDHKDTERVVKEYRLFDFPIEESGWIQEPITNGWDLDQVILAVAKRARKKDLKSIVLNMQKFESDLRKKWEKEKALEQSKRTVTKKPSLWKRLFGKG